MNDTTYSTDNSISRLQPRPNTISGLPVETVNARDLHAFLAVKSQFRDWIKNRIEDFGFTEGNDFTTAIEIYRGGERKDYHVSIDMAKELAMVERNSQGRAARQYFIECERKAKEASSPLHQVQVALNDPAQLRALLLDNVEKVLVLEAELEEAKPLAAAYDHLTRADGTLCITDAAKTLQMRPKDLFSFLQSRKWIYRRPGNGHWVGYQDKLQQGLLDHRVNEVTASDGFSKITEQVRLTAKGLANVAKLVVPV